MNTGRACSDGIRDAYYDIMSGSRSNGPRLAFLTFIWTTSRLSLIWTVHQMVCIND